MVRSARRRGVWPRVCAVVVVAWLAQCLGWRRVGPGSPGMRARGGLQCMVEVRDGRERGGEGA